MRLFSAKGRSLVGIDIGATCVKLVDIRRQQGVFHLQSYAIAPLSQEMTVDKNIADPEAVGEVIARLSQHCHVEGHDAAAAVSGAAVITKVIDMDMTLNDSEREALIRVDADQYIPYPLAEINLDFEVLGPSFVSEDKVQVLLAASRSENVQQRVDTLTFAGMHCTVMDIESHAIERAFGLIADHLPNHPRLVALVDIGQLQTTLFVAKEGEFVYSREQLFGAAQLLDAIQLRYGLSYEEASINQRQQTLPDGYYSEVLLPFMDNVILQINRALQFYFSSSSSNQIDHLVLCGDSAGYPGLLDRVQQQLGITASVANPFLKMSIADAIDYEQLQMDAPGLMVACGLALRSFD